MKASEEPESAGVAEASDALEAETAVGTVVGEVGAQGAVVVVVPAPDVVVVLVGTEVVVASGSVVVATEFARTLSVSSVLEVVEVVVDVLVVEVLVVLVELVLVLVELVLVLVELVLVLVVVPVPAVVEVEVLVEAGSVELVVDVVVAGAEVDVELESAATGAAATGPTQARAIMPPGPRRPPSVELHVAASARPLRSPTGTGVQGHRDEVSPPRRSPYVAAGDPRATSE